VRESKVAGKISKENFCFPLFLLLFNFFLLLKLTAPESGGCDAVVSIFTSGQN